MQIDLNEINVPREELQDVIDRSMDSVRKMHRRKTLIRIASRCGAAAAALVAVVGICAANPALAENLPLIGHIFEKVQEEQRYPGDYSAKADTLTGTNVCQSQGITITLSEIVCTDDALNVSVLIESDDAFPEDALHKETDPADGETDTFFLTAKQEMSFMDHDPEGPEYQEYDVRGRFLDDHTFIGACRLDFSLYPFTEFTISDHFSWDMDVTALSYFPGVGRPLTKLTEGEWSFSNEVSKQEAETITVQVDQYQPNGNGITDIRITPYEAIISYTYDESMVQPGYENFDSIYSVILDGSGQVIKNKTGLFSPQGYDLSEITIYSLPVPDETAGTEIQENLNDESSASLLPKWLEENAVSKIEIPIEG